MHEDNGQVAPCEPLWFWNPFHKASANVRILVMMSGYKAKHHQSLDLTSLLRGETRKIHYIFLFVVTRSWTHQVQSFPLSSILLQAFVLLAVALVFVCRDQHRASVRWRHQKRILRQELENQLVRWAPSMPTRTNQMLKDLKVREE